MLEVFAGLVILALDIYAILNVIGSDAVLGSTKVVWVLVIALLPVLGLIIWAFAGPRASPA